MNAPPWPLNPNIGDWFGNWVWNGNRWVAASTTGLRVIERTFWASGPYMPSPGLVSLTVELVGGGGAGGGAALPATGARIVGGGGGGAGAYMRNTFPAALVRGGVLVTVGAGGGPVRGGAGGNGGLSSFGGLMVCNGGFGGNLANADPSDPLPLDPAGNIINWGGGGLGGPPQEVQPLESGGAPGQSGGTDVGASATTNAAGGNGGNGPWGGGGTGAIPNAGTLFDGGFAQGPGAGGGGGCVDGVPGAQAAGGAGQPGCCLVMEYCWGDRNQPDIGFQPPLDVNVSFPKPPWPGGQPGPWPPGAWWPPGWGWGPGPGPGPGPWGPGRSSVPGPGSREAVEFEADQIYDDQSINPQTGRPWEDEP